MQTPCREHVRCLVVEIEKGSSPRMALGCPTIASRQWLKIKAIKQRSSQLHGGSDGCVFWSWRKPKSMQAPMSALPISNLGNRRLFTTQKILTGFPMSSATQHLKMVTAYVKQPTSRKAGEGKSIWLSGFGNCALNARASIYIFDLLICWPESNPGQQKIVSNQKQKREMALVTLAGLDWGSATLTLHVHLHMY